MQRTQRNKAKSFGHRARLAVPVFAVLLAALSFASCDQSAIFYDISNETKPKDPIIPGSPSRMVMFNSKMWVSNGTLYSFDGSGWTKERSPTGGTIRSLAVAGGRLYALTIDGGSTTRTRIWRTDDGANWTAITIGASASNYSFLESLYAAGASGSETLFIGAHVPAGEADPVTAYGVLYVDGTSIEAVGSMTGLAAKDAAGALIGAAWDGARYYLATTMDGIFSSAAANSGYAIVAGTANKDYLLSGLIAVGSTVVAVGRGEVILYGSSAGFAAQSFSSKDTIFTGALAVWDDGDAANGSPDLLLAGIDEDDNSYVFGYKEIKLTAGAFPSPPVLKNPGEGSPTTVSDEDTYDSTLGQVAVNHLFQYNSGGTRILFASTFSEGLWSYRDEEWNAED